MVDETAKIGIVTVSDRASRGDKDRQGMSSGVSVYPDDESVSMRDDGHSGTVPFYPTIVCPGR